RLSRESLYTSTTSVFLLGLLCLFLFFSLNDTSTTEIYTLSLHDALPICGWPCRSFRRASGWGRLAHGVGWYCRGGRSQRFRPGCLESVQFWGGFQAVGNQRPQ